MYHIWVLKSRAGPSNHVLWRAKCTCSQVISQISCSLVEGMLVREITCWSLTNERLTLGAPWCMVDIPDLEHGYSKCHFNTDPRRTDT